MLNLKSVSRKREGALGVDWLQNCQRMNMTTRQKEMIADIKDYVDLKINSGVYTNDYS